MWVTLPADQEAFTSFLVSIGVSNHLLKEAVSKSLPPEQGRQIVTLTNPLTLLWWKRKRKGVGHNRIYFLFYYSLNKHTWYVIETGSKTESKVSGMG